MSGSKLGNSEPRTIATIPSSLDIPPFLAHSGLCPQTFITLKEALRAPSFSILIFSGATVAVTLRTELTHGSRFPSFFLEFLVG